MEDAEDGINGGKEGEGMKRQERKTERGGVTRWGGRCHDLLGTRCDPYGKKVRRWKGI